MAKTRKTEISPLPIESWPIDRVKPYEKNARKIPQAAIDAVALSIREHGFVQPIVVDRKGVIVIGHVRRLAALELGLTKVPVHISKLPADRIRTLRLADNRSHEYAGWDLELLTAEMLELKTAGVDLALTTFTSRELDALLRVDNPAEDDVPPVPVAPVSRLGDLWEMGGHRLLCGDSTKAEDVQRLMNQELADCVFTSPPYAVGIDYGGYEDTIENLRTLLSAVSIDWLRRVKRGGYAVVNFGDVVSGKDLSGSDEVCEYPMALEHFPVFRKAGWYLWSRRIWCKPSAAVGSSRHCIGSNRAASNFEHVWTWKAPGKSLISQQTTGVFASQNGWFDSTHGVHLGVGLKVHGAGMPVSTARFGIVNHSETGAVVYEPFCGSGTTTIACEEESRRCFGMELSPAYVDVIVTRWQNLTGKQATLEGDGSTFEAVKFGRRLAAQDAILEEIEERKEATIAGR